jgi:hopene-associated glycosyltransferase HpnB
MIFLAGFLPLVIWYFLLTRRGYFWLARERDTLDQPPSPLVWPSVIAIVPARDEADVIARSIGSLLAQDYPGSFRVILVDDQSTDGTAQIAKGLGSAKLHVISGAARPAGWTGKLWAVQQGIAQAGNACDYLWLTDADIAHTTDNLSKLVARAEAKKLVLVSLMAKLHCETFAERLLIPAFVFFFDMLFPFAWVNDPGNKLAAAAGGCMLVKREALERAGGIAAIAPEIIDDCALGREMKAQGPIWLGLTDRATSLRPYGTIGEIRHMVARSAFAQLDYSLVLLTGTVAGMIVVYLLAPVAVFLVTGPSQIAAIAAWIGMTISFVPMLRFYRLSPLWSLALPLIAALYTIFTIDSAIQFWRGRGGMWKGRAQALGGT